MIYIKLTNFIHKNEPKSYNDIKDKYYIIDEKGNMYGHIREFIRLSKNIKFDAHRVISIVAVKFAGIEDAYSVTDINGNTYDFEIFEEGNYRVTRIEKFKDISKEVINEEYFKTNN